MAYNVSGHRRRGRDTGRVNKAQQPDLAYLVHSAASTAHSFKLTHQNMTQLAGWLPVDDAVCCTKLSPYPNIWSVGLTWDPITATTGDSKTCETICSSLQPTRSLCTEHTD